MEGRTGVKDSGRRTPPTSPTTEPPQKGVDDHVGGLGIGEFGQLLRRNRYRGPGLHDETPASAYWYHGGVNITGVTAQVLGTAAALLCINSTDFQSPLATGLGGADLSALVGPTVGALLYAALFHAGTGPSSPRPAPTRDHHAPERA